MLYRDWGLCMIGRNKNWSGPSDWMEEFNNEASTHIYMPKRKLKKRKSKRKLTNKKTIPLDLKTLGSDISKYPFVEIEWADIEGDSGWSNTRTLNKSALPVCVSKGYLLSQKNGITRIFVIL